MTDLEETVLLIRKLEQLNQLSGTVRKWKALLEADRETQHSMIEELFHQGSTTADLHRASGLSNPTILRIIRRRAQRAGTT